MAKLQDLRMKAKKAGVPASEIRGASASELEGLISNASGNGTTGTAVAKKAVKKVAAVKKSTATSSASKKSAPAKKKSTTGKAKRQTTRKATPSAYVPKGGRNTLGSIDYSQSDGWNPRAGSTRDRIVKLLRKYRGNRTKVFDALKPDIADFVKPRKDNGEKWGKTVRGVSERDNMLRYLIARADWDFANQTGQHVKASNRVTYGTGGTGTGAFKRVNKIRTTRSPARKAATAKKATGARKKASTAPRAARRRTTRRKAR